jgi:hypothetical protein
MLFMPDQWLQISGMKRGSPARTGKTSFVGTVSAASAHMQYAARTTSLSQRSAWLERTKINNTPLQPIEFLDR